MNRQEFMARLEALLSGIPEEEKQEALAYYAGYFEDAGEENEEQIIKELESPEKVAATIRADLNETGNEADAERSETGSSNRNAHAYENRTDYPDNAPQDNTTRNLLIVILLILSAPVWGCIVLGIGSGLIGIIAGLGGAALGCIIGGAVVFGVGIATLVGGLTAAGFISMGAGLLVLAIGFLALGLLILVCGSFLPWFVRGIVHLFQRLLYPRGGQRA